MINTELNNFWTHEVQEIITAKYRNSTVTSYTPCPEYLEKNVGVHCCRNCCFCQHIQSKPQQCKCSKHKGWETFDINKFSCYKYTKK